MTATDQSPLRLLAERVRGYSDVQRARLRDICTDEDWDIIEMALGHAGGWIPQDYQRVPDGCWAIFALVGGRGSGKSDAGAHAMDEHANGPPCDTRLPGGHRMRIIGPTFGDTIASCITGPTGLKAHNPEIEMVGTKEGTLVRWPNGASARVFGAFTPEDPERLRAGGNSCYDWFEEFAAWRQIDAAWDQAMFGLRIGANPLTVITTTPKNRPKVRELLKRGKEYAETDVALRVNLPREAQVVVTHATTADNQHLPKAVRDTLYVTYAGSRLGRQELEGELLEDNPGALWQRLWIDEKRVLDTPAGFPADLIKMVVAVDPAVTSSEESDDTGIIAAGRSKPRHCPVCGPVDAPHAFVLADRTCSDTPAGWARRAVACYEEFKADRLIAETNQGGDMVEETIRHVAPGISYEKVHAKRGKALRAQPIAALYEQRRVHHVGNFPLLEDQMTSWDPLLGMDSPDRLDALVYAIAGLGLSGRVLTAVAPSGDTSPSIWR